MKNKNSLDKVLVTGGTGVTGAALVRYLLDEGRAVTAVVRPDSSRIRYLPRHQNLQIVECSMEDYGSLRTEELGSGYSVFYHLAWDGSMGREKTDNRYNMRLQCKNIEYDINAVELCRKIGCPAFVAAGTQAEYGRCESVISEQTPAVPENGYGCAKLCAGQMTRILCSRYGIRHIWARLFSVYGPYDGAHSLIYTSILKLMSDKRPQYTAAEQMWDFMYSFDAAKALALLGEKGRDGEVYCVADGRMDQLKNYIYKIHKIVNPQIVPVFGEIPYQTKQVMSLRADITKLKKDTGFMPDYTFEEGIKEIYAWSRKELQFLGDGSEFCE